jgi:hypothetical protein
MSNHVGTNLRIRRPAPGRLELLEGGGCLTFFGLPFLGAGVFALLAAAGVVPLRTADAGSLGPLVVLLVGAAMTAVGAWLVLGRSWTHVDGARRTVTRSLGLLVPMRTRVHRLEAFSAVRLQLSRDSEGPDTYPVALVRGEGHLKVCSTNDYGRSREAAAALAEVAGLPLEDATTAHPAVLRPEELGAGYLERLRGAPAPEVPRPAELRSEVSAAGAGVAIRVGEGGARWRALLPLAIVAGVLSCLGPRALEFFERTRTPPAVQWAFGGFAVFLFAVIPALFALTRALRAQLGYTELRADARGIELRERGILSTRVTRIAAAELIDIDVDDEAVEAAAPPPGLRPAGRSRPVPRWLRALASRGVLVKHRGGITAFGAGLPGDEVRYLHALVLRALRS